MRRDDVRLNGEECAVPIDAAFHRTIEPLFQPGFGTESVGPLLYSLVRMTRPERLLTDVDQ